MRKWEWKGRPVGLALSRTLPAVAVLGLVIPVAGKMAEPLLPANATLT
jgi:ABC-type proline/glycine betaine transport system permease subunit